MKSRTTFHRNTGIRLGLLCLALGSIIFFNVLVMNTNRSVRITKFTTDIRHNTDAPNIVYKFGNGTAKGASVAGSGDVGSVFVDWVFPEKMKGEYIKYYQPFPDLASTEKLYYKVGRSIYKNSVVGEEKVFQLPWFQNVKFEIVVDSIGQFLLMIDE
ncbi:hypothetical protein BC833DRAFT_582028 [Globomyces pollinis-pini]|nr:hypothetical protein BC833DRAFT_582028 [Globomyces pollinis-pini]